MRTLLADARYALRGLLRERGFAGVAVLTLAVGIGANAAIFSVADAVLVRPLPYPEADRLTTLWEIAPDLGSEGDGINVVSRGNYLDWSDALTSYEAIGAFNTGTGLAVAGDGEPDQLVGAQMTPSAFRALGVIPELGRLFSEYDGESDRQSVVLSHSLWESRFGGDPGVLGRTILVEETPRVVVGVMPTRFQFPSPEVALWLPLIFTPEDRQSRRSHEWRVIGRLRPGVTLEGAHAELVGVAASIAQEHPEFMEGWTATARSYREDRTRGVHAEVLLLVGMVGIVLLIACANVANLLLARGIDRQREIAVRRALGAGTGRLLRQLLTEIGVLAALGLGAGLLLAGFALDALLAIAPSDVPFLEHARLDFRVLAFTSGVVVLVTMAFGLVPALRMASRVGVRSQGLQVGTLSASPRHLRQGFLVVQVAGAAVLIIGAGLFLRSLHALGEVDPGYDLSNVIAISVDVPAARYFEQAAQDDLYDRFLAELRAVPGVVSAVGTAEPPVVGYRVTFSFVVEGRPRPGPNPRQDPVLLHAVTPGYIEALRVPVVEGRPFDPTDGPGALPVAIVNRALADRIWPTGDAVGARIQFAEGQPWVEIVGIVGNTNDLALDTAPAPALYIPHGQRLWPWMSWMTVLVRTEGDPVSLAPLMREALWRVDDRLPVRRLATLSELYRERAGGRDFLARLLGGFAAVALFLGAVGVYGVVACSVGQRRREIAVRMALGARAVEIGRSFVAEGGRATGIGLALGLGLAYSGRNAVSGLLYGVEPADPLTFSMAVLLLAVAAVLGSWIPARQAARTNPMECLRNG